MKYLSLLWMRGLVTAEGERRERAPEGGERREDTYQLGLASSLELSYLKCGRGVFDEIGITQSQEGD